MRKYLLTRRALLLSGIAVATVSAAPATRWLEQRRFFRRVDRQFAEIFGDETLAQQVSAQFLEDYKNALLSNVFKHSPTILTRHFLQSSNFLEHHQTGVALDYDGLFDPYTSPCNSHLTFNFTFHPTGS
jgi:hypothetical protein